jgi:hypothetical protein
MALDQIMQPIMQSPEWCFVPWQNENIVGDYMGKSQERLEPIAERVGFWLHREHGYVGGDFRQHLIAGNEEVQLRAIETKMLR